MAQGNTPALRERFGTIQHFLKAKAGAYKDLLPKHLTPERMVRGVMSAATRNPTLLQCTEVSILNAVLVASQMGLEIGLPRGGAYLVPFRNSKTGNYEAVFVPDYRGLMDLAYRSGHVKSIIARPVYSGDVFDVEYGTQEAIHHKPSMTDPGELVAVYAVATMQDGGTVQVVYPKWKVEQHRNRSRAKESGPWKEDYEAMALKTAVKGLCNWLPQASQLQRAVAYDTRVDAGEGVSDLFDVIEVDAEPVEARSAGVKERLGSDPTGSPRRGASEFRTAA